MTIILNGQSLDQEIINLESIDKTHDDYIKSCEKLIFLRERKISNMELAVNGCQTKQSLVAVSEALGSFETSLLMFDSDDHKSTDGLRWHGIPTIRAGKKDKNHAGKSNVIQSQVRPSPLDTIAKSMRQIYPMLASGTKLHLERKKIENRGKKSPLLIPNQ